MLQIILLHLERAGNEDSITRRVAIQEIHQIKASGLGCNPKKQGQTTLKANLDPSREHQMSIFPHTRKYQENTELHKYNTRRQWDSGDTARQGQGGLLVFQQVHWDPKTSKQITKLGSSGI